jgi:hypothetical protein
MDAIEKRVYRLASEKESTALPRPEWREWQYNPFYKYFMARCSGTTVPEHCYPDFTYSGLCDLFRSHKRAVPQWVVDLTTEQPGQRLQGRVRYSVLKTKAKRVSF